ncbi:preprotein translocase subunit SecG [Ruminococcaceae bacterium OttesenSCG-928-I18]|nr:preprotein translocase subunit SecG [Ruminococcaceae bacterium OttesenSCG-928-I18]
MSVLEIIAGVVVLLVCVAVIFIILVQTPKGGGLSGVITGTEMMSGETRTHSKEARQVKVTRVLAIIFFAVVILVNVFSALQS